MSWRTSEARFRGFKLNRLRAKGYLPALSKQEARKLIDEACLSFPITRYETKTKRTRKKLIATDKLETSVLPMTLPVDEFWRIYTAQCFKLDYSSVSLFDLSF
jgi:hypothetical protein